jgi:prepilin-type processing-associated H-X9-DG protein
MGMSAVANALRSPGAADRDPGLLMPTYAKLLAGAKAGVSIGRIEGDELIWQGVGDRSMLVNLCGGIGALGGAPSAVAVGALSAGVMLPAIQNARHAALVTRSAAQLRQIGMALTAYAADHQNQYPSDLQSLTEANYCTGSHFTSPFGEEYWIDTSGVSMTHVPNPPARIMAYDRAMYRRGGKVAVLFLDGHVQVLSPQEFEWRTEGTGPNAGVDFDLPSGG